MIFYLLFVKFFFNNANLETGIFNKTDAEKSCANRYCNKGEKRCRFSTILYHFYRVSIIRKVSAEYGNETLTINGLRCEISNKINVGMGDTSSTRLHKGNQRNLVAFLRPGKPLAQTGAEIGEAKVKPATAACHGVVSRSRKSCAATRSRAVRARYSE